MIQHRVYFRKLKNIVGRKVACRFEGWFLFGLVPLYCRQIEWPRDPDV
jgi:hypothetical protein